MRAPARSTCSACSRASPRTLHAAARRWRPRVARAPGRPPCARAARGRCRRRQSAICFLSASRAVGQLAPLFATVGQDRAVAVSRDARQQSLQRGHLLGERRHSLIAGLLHQGTRGPLGVGARRLHSLHRAHHLGRRRLRQHDGLRLSDQLVPRVPPALCMCLCPLFGSGVRSCPFPIDGKSLLSKLAGIRPVDRAMSRDIGRVWPWTEIRFPGHAVQVTQGSTLPERR